MDFFFSVTHLLNSAKYNIIRPRRLTWRIDASLSSACFGLRKRYARTWHWAMPGDLCKSWTDLPLLRLRRGSLVVWDLLMYVTMIRVSLMSNGNHALGAHPMLTSEDRAKAAHFAHSVIGVLCLGRKDKENYQIVDLSGTNLICRQTTRCFPTHGVWGRTGVFWSVWIILHVVPQHALGIRCDLFSPYSVLGDVSAVMHVCHNYFIFVLCTMKALTCAFGQAEGKRLTAEGGTCDEFGI